MKTIKANFHPMENFSIDKMVAVFFGVAGGMVMFINTYFLDATYFISLVKASATAFACGLAGVGGKHAFTMLKNWYFNYKQKNKKQ